MTLWEMTCQNNLAANMQNRDRVLMLGQAITGSAKETLHVDHAFYADIIDASTAATEASSLRSVLVAVVLARLRSLEKASMMQQFDF